MWKSVLVLFPLLVVAPAVSADIYKCAGENGVEVYKNFPCPVESIGSHATAVAPKDQPRPAAGPKVAPHVGMTVPDLRNSSWGDPTDVEPEERMEGPSSTWGMYNTWSFGKRKVLVGPDGTVQRVQE